MRKKRLFILGGPLDNQNAGIHRVTYELLQALHNTENLEFDVTIIREKKSELFPEFNSIVLPSYQFIPGYRSFRLFVLIPLLCIFKGADYVFEPAHFGPFNLPSRIKRITLIHDLTPLRYPEFHRSISAYLQGIFIPGILKKADLILTVSKSTRNDIIQLIPDVKDKTQVLPLGPSSYLKINPDPRVLDKYKIHQPYLLTLGTIEPRKNLALLLDAFKVLKSEDKINHQLVIAGAYGWKHENFDQKLAQHPYKDDIILTSFVGDHEISSLIQLADINVYTSFYEGFGISAFEAMYLGKKTVLPANSAFLETGAQFAEYFKDNDLGDLIFALRKTRNTDHTSRTYPKRVHYSWTNCVHTFSNAIKQLDN